MSIQLVGHRPQTSSQLKSSEWRRTVRLDNCSNPVDSLSTSPVEDATAWRRLHAWCNHLDLLNDPVPPASTRRSMETQSGPPVNMAGQTGVKQWRVPTSDDQQKCPLPLLFISVVSEVLRATNEKMVVFSMLHATAEAKAVPLHATKALGGRGGIAPTHSRPRP
jgi:hypothetical protein